MLTFNISLYVNKRLPPFHCLFVEEFTTLKKFTRICIFFLLHVKNEIIYNFDTYHHKKTTGRNSESVVWKRCTYLCFF